MGDSSSEDTGRELQEIDSRRFIFSSAEIGC